MKLNAVILAGGEGKRMRGADKPFALVNDVPMVEHVLDRLHGEVAATVISASKDIDRFARYGLPCIADLDFQQKSPLVGIYSAMDYFARESPAELIADSYVLCVPVDVPVFPALLIRALFSTAKASENGICYTQTCNQAQPLFSIWSLRCLPQLKAQLEDGAWGVLSTLKVLRADVLRWEPASAAEFANINSPEDLLELQNSLVVD